MKGDGGVRSGALATSVVRTCARSAARNRISLMTWGHASASTQICTQRLPKAMKDLRRMLEANTMAARGLRAQRADRLTAQVSLDVLAGLIVEDAAGLLRHVAQVRRDHGVRELAGRVVGGERSEEQTSEL